jgi:two-component system, NarL family, nitrate/nitrite response regulator NarL
MGDFDRETENSLPEKNSKIRVVVGESAPLTASLFADALRRRGFKVGSSSSCDPTCEAAANADVFLLSENLDGISGRGLEVLRQLRTTAPKAKTILLMDVGGRDSVVEAFRSGARGVFCRNDPVELLGKCVRRVHEGQLWMNDAQLGFLVDALAGAISEHLVDAQGAALLSKREQDVVACLSKGATNAEIARELHLSENTVRNYMFRIFDKLGVCSRVELIKYVAGRSGLKLAES